MPNISPSAIFLAIELHCRMISIKKLSVFLAVASLPFISEMAYSQKNDPERIEQNIEKVIDKCAPACVRIWDYDTLSHRQMSAPFSGVVVDSDGDILTAAHVTIPGKTCKVTFPDGRECIAMALGKIELAQDKSVPDVGMMKILTKGPWPYAEMGRSSGLEFNEPCLSISYPESLFNPLPTVRFGYISHVKNAKGFVQSTCIMEPGDSGGPLFDYFGHVIALHSAVDIPEDINYEIPVDLNIKYWTALHSPTVYTSFPDSPDVINNNPPVKKAGLIPGIKGFNKRMAGVASKFQAAGLTIKSRVHGKEQRAVGTLFSLQGISQMNGRYQCVVAGKSSIVGNDSITLFDGKHRIPATVIFRDRQNDLVILQPEREIKGGIIFRQGLNDSLPAIRPGKFLVSPQPDEAAIISIAGGIPFKSGKFFSIGFLGASISPKSGPLLLVYIQSPSPASEQDMRIGDEVLSINGVPMNKAEDYGNELMKYWPGDTVTMQMSRSGAAYSKEIVLGTMPLPPMALHHPAEQFAGGKSVIRDGFEQVFSHDAILTPEMCGGPVFDIEGHFCGINIARHSRASSLVIPAEVIYSIIDRALLIRPGQQKS